MASRKGRAGQGQQAQDWLVCQAPGCQAPGPGWGPGVLGVLALEGEGGGCIGKTARRQGVSDYLQESASPGRSPDCKA